MSNICAGIVTYNPEIRRLEENINSVIKQVDKVYIVDNDSANIDGIRALVKSENTVLIENNDNYGIAKALNQMCKCAKNDGFNWILTLDQDTVIPNNLIQDFMPYTKESKIGIICPAVYYEGLEKITRGKNEIDYIRACMTSASLTNLEAWKDVNGFREDYFIDYVDNEFCMKLGIDGYKIIRVNKSIINHQLGETVEKKILGLFTVRYARHSPLRLYYMIRNNYSFIKEYQKHLPVLKEKVKLIYIIMQAIFSTEDKLECLRYVNHGFFDAKHGKMGSYDAPKQSVIKN